MIGVAAILMGLWVFATRTYHRFHPHQPQHRGRFNWRVDLRFWRRGAHDGHNKAWTEKSLVQALTATRRAGRTIVRARKGAHPSSGLPRRARTGLPAQARPVADPKAERLADSAVRAEFERLRETVSAPLP